MKYFLLITVLLSSTAIAQELIPIGEWRSHFNYQQARLVTRAENRIYCSTDNALFFYDQEDNSLNRLTRTDGLSDVSISALEFSPQAGWLIIGYESGNIDLYSDLEIINLTQIINAQLTGSRRINHISIFNELAYLSTDFGVVVLDLSKVEIKESYLNLGPAGERTAVKESVISGDSIYLATDFGIISGSITGGDNLLDFQSWKRITSPLPISNEPTNFVNIVGQSLIAGIRNAGVYLRTTNQWALIPINFSGTIKSISTNDKRIFISLEDRIVSYDLISGQTTEIGYTTSPKPNDVFVDDNGTLWIADDNSGLYGGNEPGFQNFVISGPASNNISKLYFFEDQILALHGSFNDNLIIPDDFEGFSLFENAGWEVISTDVLPFGNYMDIIGGSNAGIKAVSFGDGLLDFDDLEVTNSGTAGSPLVAASSEDRSTLLTGVGFDSGGNLWVSNYDSPQPLHRRDQQGNWTSFSFSAQSARFPISLAINEFDDVWMRLDPEEGGGIMVFNAEEDQDNLLTTAENSGDLPSRNVTDVVFDREGQAWIGTEQGIAFIPNPFNIFDESGFDAIRPIFENRFLLEDEFITSIAVDGGNRKWIGTRNGIWLFDASGENLISNYTIDNAPLPDNTIVDIEVSPFTGEIFIATTKGLVSIRGASTKASRKHLNVKIFPNPVRPGFTGEIGISGLAEDAIVKITDIGGRLIREVIAAGGTATWDTRGFGGKTAESGIYLVFSTSPDGDETFVGKIAVIR